MTEQQITELEKQSAILEEAARKVLTLSMGERPFTYSPLAIELVYRILDKGVSFERLVQVLNTHETERKEPVKVAA